MFMRPVPSMRKMNPFKMKSPIMQIASKPKIASSGSFRLKTLEPIDLTQTDILSEEDNLIYTVKILSNWGDPTNVCCSYMQFLSDQRRSINPIRMMSAPKTDENYLQKLNGNIVKDEQDMWRINWPPIEADTFSVIFIFQKHQRPMYVRIWNPQNNVDQSIKDIEVYSGKTLVCKDEIPKGFGKDLRAVAQDSGRINASQSMRYLQTLFPQLAPDGMAPSDRYGSYPVFKVRKISFEIIKNYGNPNVFGLGSIIFVNEKNEYVIKDEINRIVVENCSDFTDPLQLIPQNKETPEKCTFIAHSSFEKHPVITFFLDNMIVLKKIIVTNLDVGPSGFDCEVDHFKVFANDKFEWIGKICCTRPKEGVKPPKCIIHISPENFV